MSFKTAIEWCHHTFNPWIGCTKLVGGKVAGTRVAEDPACFHCYAATQDHFRFSRTLDGGTKHAPVSHWGHGAPRHITQTWDEPRKWNGMSGAGECQNCGTKYAPVVVKHMESGRRHDCPQCDSSEIEYERPRVFCGSLCDWADGEVSDDIRSAAFDVLDACPNLDWMLLSKREQKAVEFLTARYGRKLPDHLWLGFSAGTQEAYDIRSAAMRRLDARVKFFSFEPLFEDIQLNGGGFELGIYGGESGPDARAENVDFIRSGLRQCRMLGISPFVKQLGANVVDRNTAGFAGGPGEWPMDTRYDELVRGYQGAPVRIRLKDKKGGDLAEWPEDLRVREMPQTS